MESSPAAVLFEGVMDRVAGLRGQDGGGSAADRQLVERTAAHLSHSQLARLESYLPFLATTGNITPFVGLLGTVMGIIDAFREIGTQGTASIAAVAPGVAEALDRHRSRIVYRDPCGHRLQLLLEPNPANGVSIGHGHD